MSHLQLQLETAVSANLQLNFDGTYCLKKKGKTKYKQYENGQGSKMFDPVPNESMSPDTCTINRQAVRTIP
jgi:hypothetical protein